MAYRNLDEFLTRLEQAGDLIHVPLELDSTSHPAIAQVDAEKVHMFTTTSGIRVVRNLFSTHQRIEQALRVASLNLIAERLEQLIDIGKPGALGTMISRAMTMFSAIRTTTNRRAPSELHVQSLIDWRKDLGVALNILESDSIQAVLLTGGETPRMSSVSVRLSENEIVGEFWPDLAVGETVALVIGSDPAFMIAAHAPLPDIIHRSYFASWLRDKPLDMMRLPGLDIEIPSNAECVIAATVTEQFGEQSELEVVSVWTRPGAIYPYSLPSEREHLRNVFAEIMLPLIRRFLPGLQNIKLRGQLGVLTIHSSRADIRTFLRQLWAVPVSANIGYWLLLPDTSDVDGAIERLTLDDVKSLSKLMQGKNYLGVLLDASSKPEPWESSEHDLELEQVFWHFKRSWLHDQPAGES